MNVEARELQPQTHGSSINMLGVRVGENGHIGGDIAGASDQIRFSMRDRIKIPLAVGATAVATALGGGRSEVAHAAKLDGDSSGVDSLLLSSDVVESINRPYLEQAEIVRMKAEHLTREASFADIEPLVNLQGILNPEITKAKNPPMLTPDIEYSKQNGGPYYYIKPREGEDEYPSAGLITEVGVIENRDQYRFSFMASAIPVDFTHHKMQLSDGRVAKIQILHVLVSSGSERKGREVIPVYLNGYTSENPGVDPDINCPPRGMTINDEDPQETVLPKPGDMPPLVSYFQELNVLMDMCKKGNGFANMLIGGIPLDIATVLAYESQALEFGFDPILYSNELMLAQDNTVRTELYPWFTWNEVFASANDSKNRWRLVSYPALNSDPLPHEILDIFPGASRKDEPDIVKSDYFIGKKDTETGEVIQPDKEWITPEDLWRIPYVTGYLFSRIDGFSIYPNELTASIS